MTIPATGDVRGRGSAARHGIQAEFGGAATNIYLHYYYRGGARVPISAKSTIRTKGEQRYSYYRGASKASKPVWTNKATIATTSDRRMASVNLLTRVTAAPAAKITSLGYLPPGVTLSSTGVLSGTPINHQCATATFPLVLRATNAAGHADATINLTVASVPRAPSWNNPTLPFGPYCKVQRLIGGRISSAGSYVIDPQDGRTHRRINQYVADRMNKAKTTFAIFLGDEKSYPGKVWNHIADFNNFIDPGCPGPFTWQIKTVTTSGTVMALNPRGAAAGDGIFKTYPTRTIFYDRGMALEVTGHNAAGKPLPPLRVVLFVTHKRTYVPQHHAGPPPNTNTVHHVSLTITWGRGGTGDSAVFGAPSIQGGWNSLPAARGGTYGSHTGHAADINGWGIASIAWIQRPSGGDAYFVVNMRTSQDPGVPIRISMTHNGSPAGLHIGLKNPVADRIAIVGGLPHRQLVYHFNPAVALAKFYGKTFSLSVHV